MHKIEPEAYIFLAEQRLQQSHGFFMKAHGFVVHEYSIQPNQTVTFINDNHGVIIPYIGDLTFKNIAIEEYQACFFNQKSFKLSNTYDDDPILFFIVTFPPHLKATSEKIVDADVQSQKNKLIQLNETCFIGQYQGRKEDKHKLRSQPYNSLFIYVIAGAFEVQNRLLQHNDGLVLTNLEVLDFEALSDDAILLIFEF